MATHDDVGLSQPVASTITKRLDAISLDNNSTTVLREVMVIGSPETTNALTAVLAAAPKSTDWGLAVRVVSGPSTAADAVIRVNQGVGISTVADAWKVGPSDTNWASSAGFHFTASSGALKIGGNQSSNSSVYLGVRITNGTAFTDATPYYTHGSTGDFTGSTIASQPNLLRSGAAAYASTDHFVAQWGSSLGAAFTTPVDTGGAALWSSIVVPSTASAVSVRQAQALVSNYAVSSAFQSSTEHNVVSSNAATRPFIFAYSLTSTIGSQITIGFYDGATLKWPVTLSSAFGGANLAVTPPGYLFAGTVGSSLSIHANVAALGGSSGVTVAVSYYTGA